ncbi:RHS repeat-associated core domain-containing protein [Acidovorax sp. LjRoot117]|uniref:RHS repeat-associated core domain-containing protein n=1 Tax=Acidovorax sp. LjRoot117 TaxID=3342255 RepID=UPI003ED0E644
MAGNRVNALARIDGSGSVEPHPAAAHALGGDAEQGKQGSVPTTNPQWADRFNVAAAPNDVPTHVPAKADSRSAATGTNTAQVHYFHTQPNRLPEELSDNSGNLVWRAQYTTWGSTVREEWQSFDTAGRPQQQPGNQTASLQQNLRMQGQYLDRETGLHYNTFRYYDADLGAFTTPDPIGLNGGLNLHQYAPNPISWIDPWGWSYCPKSDRYRNDRTGRFDKDPRIKTPSSIQDRMTMEAAKKGAGTKIMDNMKNERYKGWEKWEYKVKSADGRDSVVHYVRNPQSGKTADFKFKARTSDSTGNYAKKTEPKVSSGDSPR